MRRLAVVMLAVLAMMARARAEDLVLYGAGSLRESMAQIAAVFGQAHGLTVATQFGPSGRMRERIEKGERVDVFASADIGHARKLVEDGRASAMAMFARNTVCLLAPAAFGATTENALDRLLAPGVRVGVSPAKVDPLGDYTVRLFEVAERLRPGSGAALQARAVVLDTPPVRRRRNRAIPTPMRSWAVAWMPASSIVPGAIAMRAYFPMRSSLRSRQSCRSVPNTAWPC